MVIVQKVKISREDWMDEKNSSWLCHSQKLKALTLKKFFCFTCFDLLWFLFLFPIFWIFGPKAFVICYETFICRSGVRIPEPAFSFFEIFISCFVYLLYFLLISEKKSFVYFYVLRRILAIFSFSFCYNFFHFRCFDFDFNFSWNSKTFYEKNARNFFLFKLKTELKFFHFFVYFSSKLKFHKFSKLFWGFLLTGPKIWAPCFKGGFCLFFT